MALSAVLFWFYRSLIDLGVLPNAVRLISFSLTLIILLLTHVSTVSDQVFIDLLHFNTKASFWVMFAFIFTHLLRCKLFEIVVYIGGFRLLASTQN